MIGLSRYLRALLSREWTVWVAMLLLLAFQWSAAQSSVSSSQAPLVFPSGLAFDRSGNLFFAEMGRHRVRRLTPLGVLTVAVGTGVQGFSGDGGPATSAMLDSPTGVAFDAEGGLLVADSHNGRVRRVDQVTGVISTLALARLPIALAFDGSGNVVYADAALHQVLRVEASGAQTVLAGDGVQGQSGDGGAATAASLDTPSGIAFDGFGNLFIADAHNNSVRRVDARDRLISTVALPSGLRLPRGLVADASGDLYIVDAGNQRIRRVDAITGAVTSVAGNGVQGFAGEGGAAAGAELDAPRAVALSGQGAATFSDSANGRVRQVDATGNVITIAGAGTAAVIARKSATLTGIVQSGAGIRVVVSSSATGIPKGSIALLDGGAVLASASLADASASFSTTGLSVGSHTLQAVYAGDDSFAGSTSPALVVTIGGSAAGDFSIAANGTSSASAISGSAASFSFVLTPTGVPLVSRIVLSVTGLPVGSSATFAPGFIPPSSTPVPFVLLVQSTANAAGVPWVGGVAWAGLFFGLMICRRRKRVALLAAMVLLAGCGDRVNTRSQVGLTPVIYNLLVTATGTGASGEALLHSVPVVLTVR